MSTLLTRPGVKRGLWKVASAAVALVTVFNVSAVSSVFSFATVGATGSVCPSGDVKYNVGSGYEYTDNSATVTVIPGTDGSKNRVTWAAASGFVVTSVCIKIGGQHGGSLQYPSASAGQAGPYAYDISHIVLKTSPGNTPPNVPNPPLGQSCGLDIGLIVDRSGSMDSSEMSLVKSAMTTFVDAFIGTPTQFSLTKFETNATVTQAFTSDLALMKSKIGALPASGDGNTNWDAALAKSFSTFDPRPTKPNLIVIATDGSPNRYGDPANSTFDWNLGLSNAVSRANTIKTAGTRIVVIGIGSDPTDPDYPNTDVKLQAISGPKMAPPATIDETVDVVKTDFPQLAAAMSNLAKGLCGGKILVQKQLDLDGDGKVDLDGTASDARLSGFTFDVDGTPSNPVAKTTTNTGALEFDVLNGTYSLNESAVMGMRLSSIECRNGQNAVGTVDLATRTVTGLAMTTDDTVTCTFVNTPSTGTLKVIKQVVGGELPAASWMLHVKHDGTDVAGSPAAGSATGTVYTLPVGTYAVSETGPAGYTASFSSACSAGTVTVTAGQQTVCTVTNTLIPEFGLTLDKQAPVTVNAGANLTYTLLWTVGGNTPLTNTVLTDPIPANTSFVAADNGGTFNNGVVTWNLGTKQPGNSGSLTVTVKVNSPLANGTDIVNTACIDALQTESVCDTTTTKVVSSPKLSITKSNNAGEFTNPGKIVRYTVVVTNAADATDSAKDVVLTDVLPAGFTFVDGGASQKSFNLGTLAPGASVSTSYDVAISADHAAGIFTNTADAKGTNTDKVNATSNVEVRIPQVIGEQTAPDLAITKKVNKTTAKPGDVVTYTVTVKSIGTEDAVNVVVTDTLPKNLSFVNFKGRSHAWKLGTLAVGKSVSIDYDVRVESDAKRGSYKNVAVATADEVGKKQANAKLEVRTPTVLGAELPVTGSGPMDYIAFVLGALLALLGLIGLRQRGTDDHRSMNFIHLA